MIFVLKFAMQHYGGMEILFVTLPALITCLVSILLVKIFLNEEQDRRNVELKLKTADKMFPLRLNAYERMVLFIERCNPSNMLLRNYEPGMGVKELQQRALDDIRTEYEHNQTQQLYVSDNAWKLVIRIRDETRRLINEQVVTLPENSTAAELSRKILETQSRLDPDPYSFAIGALKAEVNAYY